MRLVASYVVHRNAVGTVDGLLLLWNNEEGQKRREEIENMLRGTAN